MSIHQHPAKEPLVPPTSPLWGEVASNEQRVHSIRFLLPDRVVSFPLGELHRWEHVAGNPERLMIVAGREQVEIEGLNLKEVCEALDASKLCAVRVNRQRHGSKKNPVIHRITIESI